MIHPRPTQHVQATPTDYIVASVNLPTRPPAWCRTCGCKLSRYRPPVTSECWTCERRRIYTVPITELHPPTCYEKQLTRTKHAICVDCGGACHKAAQRCRRCHSLWKGQP